MSESAIPIVAIIAGILVLMLPWLLRGKRGHLPDRMRSRSTDNVVGSEPSRRRPKDSG